LYSICIFIDDSPFLVQTTVFLPHDNVLSFSISSTLDIKNNSSCVNKSAALEVELLPPFAALCVRSDISGSTLV